MVIAMLERYKRLLITFDSEAARLTNDEYLDLLSDGEVADILCTRDEVAESPLTSEQARDLEVLDTLLWKHRDVFAMHTPELNPPAGAGWWWRIHTLHALPRTAA